MARNMYTHTTHTHTLDDTAVFSEEVVSAESAHKGYSRRRHDTNNVSMNDQLSVRMEDKTYNQNRAQSQLQVMK